jgi:hypothetical protein
MTDNIIVNRKGSNRVKKGQTEQRMVDKILHRKLNSNEHKPHLKFGVTSGAPEGRDVPAPFEAFIMLRLLILP